MNGRAGLSTLLPRATRARIARGAARLGLERPLRRLQGLADPSVRRARVEEERFRELCAATLAPDDCCVDVGAHAGSLLRLIVAAAPEGHHVAFEPLPDFCEQLRREFPAVDVRNAAVWDETGTSSFECVVSEPAYSGLRRASYPRDWTTESLTVATVTLDEALPGDYAPRLVKVDVEGAELQVFRGARRLLAAHRPVLFFEHQPGSAERYGGGPGELFDLLAGELGYAIYGLGGDGPYGPEAFEREFTTGATNFIARA